MWTSRSRALSKAQRPYPPYNSYDLIRPPPYEQQRHPLWQRAPCMCTCFLFRLEPHSSHTAHATVRVRLRRARPSPRQHTCTHAPHAPHEHAASFGGLGGREHLVVGGVGGGSGAVRHVLTQHRQRVARQRLEIQEHLTYSRTCPDPSRSSSVVERLRQDTRRCWVFFAAGECSGAYGHVTPLRICDGALIERRGGTRLSFSVVPGTRAPCRGRRPASRSDPCVVRRL